MTMMARRRKLSAAVAGVLVMYQASPLGAHNSAVHQSMTDFSYQVMRLVAQPNPSDRLVTQNGPVDPAAWDAYLAAIAAAVPKLRKLPAGLPAQKSSRCAPPPSTEPPPDWAVNLQLGALPYAVKSNYITGSAFDCGVNKAYTEEPIMAMFGDGSGDLAGPALGFWAQHIDDETDDFHGEIKPLNAAGLGYLKDKLSDAAELGLLIALVPFICLANCLFGAFGDCDDCIEQAKQAAQDGNPINNIESLLPGFGDFTGSTYTGLWHFINMRPGAANYYDDRQGMLYEEAGPFGVPGAVDLAITVLADAVGLTMNGSESLGTTRYQIAGANDAHPNTSPIRDSNDFEVTTIGHVAFEPLDNLGFYGWRKFQTDPKHTANWLAWPLHALGDATVPMHVAGTTSWGHRPYEDAAEQLFPKIVARDTAISQLGPARAALLRGFEWYTFIQNWRKDHQSNDVPVRALVTALAQKTFSYAISQGVPGLSWPFVDVRSVTYLAGLEAPTLEYMADPNAVSRGQTLMLDGMGAIIAFLTATGEVLP